MSFWVLAHSAKLFQINIIHIYVICLFRCIFLSFYGYFHGPHEIRSALKLILKSQCHGNTEIILNIFRNYHGHDHIRFSQIFPRRGLLRAWERVLIPSCSDLGNVSIRQRHKEDTKVLIFQNSVFRISAHSSPYRGSSPVCVGPCASSIGQPTYQIVTLRSIISYEVATR